MKWAGSAVAVCLGMSSLVVSPDARAHPHGWIDLSVRVITDDQGMVSGLHQTWRMDPFYSLVVFEELQQVENASLEEGLDQLGKEIRDNLALLTYQVFDSTYYIEVVHEEEGGQPRDDALILHGEPSCELSILPADPDPELVMQAALLDKDESGEPGLGRYFAETGQVDCR